MSHAGFRRITFRGDTDFSQTPHLDRWAAGGRAVRVRLRCPPECDRLCRRVAGRRLDPLPPPGDADPDGAAPAARQRESRHHRGARLQEFRLDAEAVAEFPYQPTACARPYRMVVVRKNISVEQGDHRLFDQIRYFFYLTNDQETAAPQIVFLANDRCQQENLIEQLKHGVGATRMPVDALLSNWAYMVMASLAWSLKAWFALCLPATGRWATRYAAEKAAVLRMEFKGFLHAFVLIPVQVVRTSRRLVFRLLAWNPWQAVLLRGSITGVPRCAADGPH